MNNSDSTNLRVPRELADRLKAVAKKTKRSLAGFTVSALEQVLAEIESKQLTPTPLSIITETRNEMGHQLEDSLSSVSELRRQMEAIQSEWSTITPILREWMDERKVQVTHREPPPVRYGEKHKGRGKSA